MAGLLDGVDRRTQLAGHNRLELLLFKLKGRQMYGINVFKVQEVIQCPQLTHVPHAHPVVRGVANLRGKTISLMDLGMAIGDRPLDDTGDSYVIITEYNQHTQGFLVKGVDRIINLNWDEIHPPPKGSGNNYMTAVTNVDGKLVEIIDVEKVMAEVMPTSDTVDDSIVAANQGNDAVPQHILVADDSSVARNQIKRTLDQIGVECTLAKNGREALTILKAWADDEEIPVTQRISMLISDIEMPEMDGYTLTTEVRKDPRLRDLYVLLHTSLSGVFNNALVDKVGANEFIAKFRPDDLANAVLKRMKAFREDKAAHAEV